MPRPAQQADNESPSDPADGAGGGSVSAAASDTPAGLAQREDVAEFIRRMVATHDYDAARLQAVFADAQISREVLEAISRPAEALPWHRYRAIFLKPARIRQGVEFWRQRQASLQRAAQVYGVQPEIVVAILGVETRYGRVTGSYKVIDSLSTLAFDYPKRARFFAGELEQYLLLAREQSLDPRELMGSYAGAMGIPQFISSSYRAYAVDFDADGRIDIWQNPTDAIGSVGNYFQQHGWRPGAAITAPARAPDADLTALLTSGLKPELSMAEMSAGGVSSALAVEPDEKVKLLQLENRTGHEYWLAGHNFYVLTRYNHSALYAMAVYQLAQAIREQFRDGSE